MPETAPAETELAALRAEIDRLDDALHDLLMRRVDVVARLAASGAKGEGPAIRPGREAAILRRLLARHRGPLPRSRLLRLWRELLAATTSLQTPLTIAAWLPDEGIGILRTHFGLAAPIMPARSTRAALAACGTGEAALAALPAAGGWWLEDLPEGVCVVARLPFLDAGEPPVLLLSTVPPDASGDDRSVARMPADALAALNGRELAREDGFVLAEIPGAFAAGDGRLLGAGATLLGRYAVPVAA